MTERRIDHSHCREWLPFYVAGTLPASKREAVENHLRTCVECRTAVAQWGQIAAIVRAESGQRAKRLPTLDRARLTSEKQSSQRILSMNIHPGFVKSRVRVPGLMSIAALAALIVILFGMMRQPPPSAIFSLAQQSASASTATATPFLTLTPFPVLITTTHLGSITQVTICGVFDAGTDYQCHSFDMAFTHENSPGDMPADQRPLFGGMFMLRGIAFGQTDEPSGVRAGSSFNLALLWELGANSITMEDYRVSFQLISGGGQVVDEYRNFLVQLGQPDNVPSMFRSAQPDGISLMNYNIPVPSNILPGGYTVLVSIINIKTDRLTLSDGTKFYAVGTIYVLPEAKTGTTPLPTAIFIPTNKPTAIP